MNCLTPEKYQFLMSAKKFEEGNVLQYVCNSVDRRYLPPHPPSPTPHPEVEASSSMF